MIVTKMILHEKRTYGKMIVYSKRVSWEWFCIINDGHKMILPEKRTCGKMIVYRKKNISLVW